MASSSIRMRVLLTSDPKVIRMAEHLSADSSFLNWLGVSKVVNQDVTRCIAVAGLLRAWGVASERGKRIGKSDDMRVNGAGIESIDSMAGVPGLGRSMAAVKWAVADGEALVFPNYLRDNESQADIRAREQAAERKRRQRSRERGEPEEDDRPEPVSIQPPPPPLPPYPDGADSEPPVGDDAEARIRRWAGNVLSASDRMAIFRAEQMARDRGEVTIAGRRVSVEALFLKAIDEAIASSHGPFRSASFFLRFVNTIVARCERDGMWPGEHPERINGVVEKSTAELLKEEQARRGR